jgi:pyruvate dehydrogenase E1 component alpha subunit
MDDAIALYKKMLLIRMFEEKAASLYVQGHIFGFCHLYIGQEAIAVGINFVLGSQDSQITSYRDHGIMLSCGVPPQIVMAELCGKASGSSKGKGGSMHLFSKRHLFFGGNGIVGSQVSIGTGLAFAHKYKEDGGMSVVYFGDGAANQGQVFESFNMASLWKLPIMFILENNKYAMGTPLSRAASGKNLGQRCESFGILSLEVDGMDVLDVIKKANQVKERIKEGGGPVLLHMDTYRYKGHSMSDPATYRSKEEVSTTKKNRDPIEKIKNVLSYQYRLNNDAFIEIDAEIKQTIKEAADFAITTPFPEENQIATDVLKSNFSFA